MSFYNIVLDPVILTSFSNRDTKNGRVFLGVITVPNSKRRNIPWTEWMYRMNQEGFHKAMFIEQTQSDYPEYYLNINKTLLNLPKKPKVLPADRDRSSKRVTGAQYMIKHLEYDWYWSLTDDVYVDISALDNYITELLQIYDPRKDFVIAGQYMKRIGYEYLQGGSGMIFSRKAAEIFVEKGEDWIKNVSLCDDCQIEYFFHSIGKKVISASSDRMFGSGLVFYPILANYFPKLMIPCKLYNYFGVKTVPINKSIALHPVHNMDPNLWYKIQYTKYFHPEVEYFITKNGGRIYFCNN